MSKTAMIRARMEPTLKVEAEAVLAQVGLSPTEAIRSGRFALRGTDSECRDTRRNQRDPHKQETQNLQKRFFSHADG